MKKALSFLSFLILNISLISARDYFEEIKYSLKDVLINPTDNMLIIQIVLFLLFFVIIFTTLQKSNFLRDRKANAIISLAISLMAVYYMSQEMLSYILTTYTALGLVITAFLPLLIILFFIHKSKMSAIGRKMVLGLFALFFAYLWYQHFKETGELWNNMYIIIGATIAASWGFDRDLHKMLKKKYKPEE
jgi:hypothetical protein